MIEIFVVKDRDKVFKCLLPDGQVYEGPGLLKARGIMEFIDVETKIVYFPTENPENEGTGDVEIEIYDTFEEALEARDFLRKII